jgi:hypothetical protein
MRVISVEYGVSCCEGVAGEVFIGDRRRGLGGGCAPLSAALSSIGG